MPSMIFTSLKFTERNKYQTDLENWFEFLGMS